MNSALPKNNDSGFKMKGLGRGGR